MRLRNNFVMYIVLCLHVATCIADIGQLCKACHAMCAMPYMPIYSATEDFICY